MFDTKKIWLYAIINQTLLVPSLQQSLFLKMRHGKIKLAYDCTHMLTLSFVITLSHHIVFYEPPPIRVYVLFFVITHLWTFPVSSTPLQYEYHLNCSSKYSTTKDSLAFAFCIKYQSYFLLPFFLFSTNWMLSSLRIWALLINKGTRGCTCNFNFALRLCSWT